MAIKMLYKIKDKMRDCKYKYVKKEDEREREMKKNLYFHYRTSQNLLDVFGNSDVLFN